MFFALHCQKKESIAQANLDATTSFTITDVVISYFKTKLLEQVSQIQNERVKKYEAKYGSQSVKKCFAQRV
ncbi:MAG: hypothetical protein LBU10_00460 [Endomicrobium sp.]|nr:hypothetical protein [Endomicrobium sp.]